MDIILPKRKYYENISNTIIKNLSKRQIEGYYCENSKLAIQKALELMPKGSSVSWGGSMTLIETGLLDTIQNENYKIINRDTAKTSEEQRKIYGEICMSDFFLMSTNAITIDGELINIDGRGNRVAFLCYGPQNVIISDVESGFKRVRDIASPLNTVRLNKQTPCSITGKCEDCYSPDCICGQFILTRRSSIPNRIKVILIGEELGY